ncbi:MAG: hypothetical protein ACI4J5_02735 [Oscillospiraceae bacterium]
MKLITLIENKIYAHPIMIRITGHPLGRLFLTDMLFRTKLSLCCGLAVNFLFAAVQLIFGICTRSVRSGSLAVYYVLLAVMRYQLLKPPKNADEKDIIHELRKYRFCGVVMIFMTPIFAGILILIVHKNSRADYPGILLYIMAIYSLCCIIIAAVNLVKYRSCGSPVISAAKAISLTVALISVLSFETAAVTRFGNEKNEAFLKAVVGTSCGAVCVIVLTMAIIMTVRGTQHLKLLTGSSQKKKGDEGI